MKYIGVEAFPIESKDELVREYGQNAQAYNESLVGGKKIEIVWDSQIRDKENRYLAYVYLEDGRFVNREILALGHAKASISPPNRKWEPLLRGAEIEARRKRAGLWKNEPKSISDQAYYVGEINTKTYYMPYSPELSRIPESHLRRFASRVDAVAAGFKPCHDCRGSSVKE